MSEISSIIDKANRNVLNFSQEIQKFLDEYLASRSFIEGYTLSKSDAIISASILKNNITISPERKHLIRWFSHISSYTPEELQHLPPLSQVCLLKNSNMCPK